MCFGPSKKEQAVAAESQQVQQEAADAAQFEEAKRRAEVKAADIQQAVSSRIVRKGMSGGAGRRSLFSSSGAGFLGRFE